MRSVEGPIRIRLGTRRWDHLLPITIGEVTDPRISISHKRFDLTPTADEMADLDIAEKSLGHLLLGPEDPEWMPLPCFPLSSFRHRCFVVRRDSPLSSIADLSGARIGLTGWSDTGNAWTKALIAEAGVDFSDITWRIGPLEQGEPYRDRLVFYQGRDLDVRPLPAHACLNEQLASGELDAILTPTMPFGFHRPGSVFRHLLVDFPSAEQAYYRAHQFVPGIHTMIIRRSLVERYPWLPRAAVDVLQHSFRHWQAERLTLVDTSIWLINEITTVGNTVGLDWNPYDPAWTEQMLTELLGHLAQQSVQAPTRAPSAVYQDFRSVAGQGGSLPDCLCVGVLKGAPGD